MPKANDILWYKRQFKTSIEAAIEDTPFSVDMVTASACQDTEFIGQVLRKNANSASEEY